MRSASAALCLAVLAGTAVAGPIPLPQVKPRPPAATENILLTDPGPVSLATLLHFGKQSANQGVPLPPRKPAYKPAKRRDESDAALYRKIFAAQDRADWTAADALLAQVQDRRLVGHVLYQRYMHPTGYRARFAELSAWMKAYAAYPGAPKIHALAMRRAPQDGAKNLANPVRANGLNGLLGVLADSDRSLPSPADRTRAQTAAITDLEAAVSAALKDGAPERAARTLRNTRAAALLDSVEYDALRTRIAERFMTDGAPSRALDLAAPAATRSGDVLPLAGWIGGLSAWRLGDYRRAAALFERTAGSPYASDWTAAGGAYWASRAHLRAGDMDAVTPWLRRAAAHPRTFYGLIATRALGWDFDFNWTVPPWTADSREILSRHPAGARAMLLVDAGQTRLAAAELRRINPAGDPALARALLAYAAEAGLPAYAMRLASAVAAPDGALYDVGLYPLLPWTPKGGYGVDRALIHALIRQESKFDPAAQNASGATGLMQLMPATASFVAGQPAYRSAEGRERLKDPQINLDIGQQYVADLLRQAPVDKNLFALVIAYNAGPGNLKKWQDSYKALRDDPLLFVETIPIRETRDFVEKVMANYWIYRLRMNQPAPSLDEAAEGRWARYVRLDEPYQVATGG